MDRLTEKIEEHYIARLERLNGKIVGNQMCMDKLGQLEDAEEKGLLLKLPCKIGDDVYIIPSKVNFKLNILSKHEENNRIYHQKVERITFTRNGWYLKCDKDVEYGTDRIRVDRFFGETWFLSEEEAEQALQRMKEGV